ncbi:MAG: ADP-dependent glucokinase/phosphofructokinase [Treponema sp.]|jgi:ADP-dependent phosphofructokinase/glucokinase|nr:ADP-dependent glucokinase/phosphofructokinase [Treponema sp.]
MGEQIVLGLGDNIDYEIRWDSALLERLIRDADLSASEINRDIEINTPRNLLASILGFVRNSSGGERFVQNPHLIEGFSGSFEKKITLGGTAVRAAIAMWKLGYTSAVHLVTMNEHVERLLPAGCPRLCSNRGISSYPHLIIQFNAGVRLDAGDIHIETVRPNRIIYTNDPDNALMCLHPDLPALLQDAKVFLISGFNTMQDISLLEERLKQLRVMLEGLSKKILVFYEDSGFHREGISAIVRRFLLKYIDIYSLNEDEMQGYLGQPLALTDSKTVASALEDLYRIIPCPALILHTRYWALAYCPAGGAGDYAGPLLGGITMATARFRFGDDFTCKDYAGTGALPREDRGTAFAGEIQALLGDRVCCVPSFLVPEKNVTTIGLGDTFAGGFLPALL